jgi:MYXO-CTERM domain-containing protein
MGAGGTTVCISTPEGTDDCEETTPEPEAPKTYCAPPNWDVWGGGGGGSVGISFEENDKSSTQNPEGPDPANDAGTDSGGSSGCQAAASANSSAMAVLLLMFTMLVATLRRRES